MISCHKNTNYQIIHNITKYSLIESIENICTNTRSIIIVPNLCNIEYKYGGIFNNKLSTKYPIVEESYNILGKNFINNNPGYVQCTNVAKYNNGSKIIVANMLCQNGITNKDKKRSIDYGYLTDSMNKIKRLIIKYQDLYKDEHFDISIHTYKFGTNKSCNANWSFISCLIEDIWLSYSNIYVYNA